MPAHRHGSGVAWCSDFELAYSIAQATERKRTCKRQQRNCELPGVPALNLDLAKTAAVMAYLIMELRNLLGKQRGEFEVPWRRI